MSQGLHKTIPEIKIKKTTGLSAEYPMQQHISHKKYIVYFKKALTKTSITSHRNVKFEKYKF